VAEPVSVRVETFGTGKVGEAKLTELVRKNFSLTPKGIIESLNLRRPIYRRPQPTATSAAPSPSSPGKPPTKPPPSPNRPASPPPPSSFRVPVQVRVVVAIHAHFIELIYRVPTRFAKE
jgi:hypothetical protein